MKILIVRLSAMGDVALSVPVIQSLSEQYLDDEIFILTRKVFNPFFKGIKNLTLISPDLKGKHKSILGLIKLFNEIKKEYKPDVIIDLHNVLRSKILRLFFKLSNVKSYKIDKGRKEKKLLTKEKNKNLKKLKHTTQSYIDTFSKAGIHINLTYTALPGKFEMSSNIESLLQSSSKKIGIAPFAMHEQKQYPIDKMKGVINSLVSKKYEIFIFGGGKQEQEIAKSISAGSDNIHSVIGKFSLEEEIALISKLDLMISMDSANMHIAALTGIDIVSIWGATHPFAGFTPFINDEKSHIIQNESLDCRPCSVYGNKVCYKGTLECMNSILPEEIVKHCEAALK